MHSDFCELLAGHSDLMQRLQYVRHLKPQAYLAAGVIRNLVWSALHQQPYEIFGTEIDVVYFDQTAGTTWQHEQQQLTSALQQAFPENTWDVVNQAYVHHWYRTEQGQPIKAYESLEQALATWPETATAIAVALDNDHQLKIVAPFGLDDLMQLKLRWNDTLVSYALFLQRIHSKRFLEKWPKLKF
ncbi:nucleotidyltransferase family protein [Acinetobacter rudis]|uniref:Nucleotidyltransferase family protein n=1 Tax=Acinetobacter rudis CIP 110305 TaxID=421052 RepID=S3NTI6_9GAMM|nr:nucleotidyltransferase family protein [Acinetobacter rudis]EPF81728.1 hypothetical protein F945_00063 [Acinetobacter rudis CIP 110305]